MSMRLQKWNIAMGAYDFKIILRAGKYNTVPDCLSRLPLSVDKETIDNISTDNTKNNLWDIPINFNKVLEETYKDKEILDIINDIRKGDENKIVIPAGMRKTMLKELNIGNLGAGKTKALAKDYMYWPVKSITTDITLKELMKTISIFGIPEEIVTDNGTNFTSHSFDIFCKDHGIKHTLTAAYHQQSNGQINTVNIEGVHEFKSDKAENKDFDLLNISVNNMTEDFNDNDNNITCL
ncbi:uncharacterized protein LOC135932045 [Gordionus sp. m RMFG-2023]|uniref:uncharacterized protein LOC135932045 n=1 Tax=Gordionus sp. m RMFG-2023 TaxID=3053472 RepID=UPI0031FD7929